MESVERHRTRWHVRAPQNQPVAAEVPQVTFAASPAIPALAGVVGILAACILGYGLWRYYQHYRRTRRATSSALSVEAATGQVGEKSGRFKLPKLTIGRSKTSTGDVVVLPTQPLTPHLADWRPVTLTPWGQGSQLQRDRAEPTFPRPLVTKGAFGGVDFRRPEKGSHANFQALALPPPQYRGRFTRSRSPPPWSELGMEFAPPQHDKLLPLPPSSPIRASSLAPSPGALSFAAQCERDSYFGVTPPPDPSDGPFPRLVVVTSTFQPSLEDELVIKLGETLRLLEEYEDGWCLAQRVGPALKSGAVPRFCLQERESTVFVPGLSGGAIVRRDSDARKRAIDAKQQEKVNKDARKATVAPEGTTSPSKRSRFSSWISAKSPLSPISPTSSSGETSPPHTPNTGVPFPPNGEERISEMWEPIIPRESMPPHPPRTSRFPSTSKLPFRPGEVSPSVLGHFPPTPQASSMPTPPSPVAVRSTKASIHSISSTRIPRL